MVGFLALIGNEVGGLFVDSKYHGGGIGRALMDLARRTRDFLELDVFEDNKVEREFYKNYVFRHVGQHVDVETGFIQVRLRLTCSGARHRANQRLGGQ